MWSGEVSPAGFHYRYYSPAVKEITGRPPSFYIEDASRWSSTVHPDDLPAAQASADRLLSGESMAEELEYRVLLPDGGIRWVRDRVVSERRGDTILLNGVVRDITERRQVERERHELEIRVQQAQRLESLGMLASGIAHDFNNLLVSVLGSADLAMLELGPEHAVRGDLLRIKAAANQCADLCQQLLAYSGKGGNEARRVELPTLIVEMVQLLEVSISKAHAISYQFEPGLAPVFGDPTQLRQVVMNLVTNASEAIGERAGTIVLRAGLATEPREVLAERFDLVPGALSAADYVRLEVEDSGKGMDESTRARIFEPFFTSKVTGRGLGLSVVQGIVRAQGGAIRVQSALGRGTTFELLLPVDARSDVRRPGRQDTGAGESGVHARLCVLVVDDDERVRAVCKRMLELHGYDVLLAADGVEGLERYRDHRERVALVLADLIMPRMHGRELCARLRAENPRVKLVVISGHDVRAVAPELVEAGVGVLAKPFRVGELLGAIEEVLEDEGEMGEARGRVGRAP
nr:PAS domain-containing sensor histidine kinase [Pseudenhygromyxa sp. WMMC2535]